MAWRSAPPGLTWLLSKQNLFETHLQALLLSALCTRRELRMAECFLNLRDSQMISDVSAIMRLQNATIGTDQKIGGQFAHLPVHAAPETITHRADPVDIKARQQHGQ